MVSRNNDITINLVFKALVSRKPSEQHPGRKCKNRVRYWNGYHQSTYFISFWILFVLWKFHTCRLVIMVSWAITYAAKFNSDGMQLHKMERIVSHVTITTIKIIELSFALPKCYHVLFSQGSSSEIKISKSLALWRISLNNLKLCCCCRNWIGK